MTTPDSQQPIQPPPAYGAAPTQPALRPENILRGTLFALIAIPAGVLVWVIIWSIGIVASIVAFGVAVFTVWLYRKGSGGAVSRTGAFITSAIILVTLLLAFYFGLVVDYVRAASDQSGIAPLDIFQNPNFWNYFGMDFPEIVRLNGFNLLLALAFGVLGSFSILRNVFRAAKAHEQAYANPNMDNLYPGAGAPSGYAPPAYPAPGAVAPGSATPPAPVNRPATPAYGEYAPPVAPAPAADPAADPATASNPENPTPPRP